MRIQDPKDALSIIASGTHSVCAYAKSCYSRSRPKGGDRLVDYDGTGIPQHEGLLCVIWLDSGWAII